MNNPFKKSIFLLATIFFSCNVVYGQERRKPQRTVEDLTKIAKKYGMEAVVPSLKNSTLIYDDINEVEQYFQNQSTPYKMHLEYTEFSNKTINVRTHKDYFDLMDKYPTMKENFLKSNKWDTKAHNEYVAKVSKFKWRIYRDKFGGLSFYKADTKADKSEQGSRLDNLPPAKE